MSKNKDTLLISNSCNDRILPIAPVILPQWILGGIVVAGLLFSEMPAALPVDEADLLNRPDGYSASLKLAERIRIGNSTASTEVSHLNTIITSTIFYSFGTHRDLATLARFKN